MWKMQGPKATLILFRHVSLDKLNMWRQGWNLDFNGVMHAICLILLCLSTLSVAHKVTADGLERPRMLPD
jgi:hypothetical protein